jgi:hypothetical protein
MTSRYAWLALGVIPASLTEEQMTIAKKALQIAEMKRLQKIKKQKRKKGRK